MWFLEKWLENPKIVKKLNYVLYAALVIVCILGVAVHFAEPAEHEAAVEHDEVAEEHEEVAAEHEVVVEHEVPAGHEEHAPFAFEQIPVFSAIFGFVICALLGLGAKAYGHNVVMKEEDYYDR
ncbi:MAG TPA: hypothetical protein C5S51_06045 [Methanosarcinaceae archaeon]|nr:hypothetical protein [Methanosarcinaceae archaeon]